MLNKCWWGRRTGRITYCWQVQIGIITFKTHVSVSPKTKHMCTLRSSNLTPEYILRNRDTYVHPNTFITALRKIAKKKTGNHPKSLHSRMDKVHTIPTSQKWRENKCHLRLTQCSAKEASQERSVYSRIPLVWSWSTGQTMLWRQNSGYLEEGERMDRGTGGEGGGLPMCWEHFISWCGY